ncbi:MAG: helix-turn-helix domain-containing protein [Nanoarchaeota archaeon]|nr:helix-turn-helix domain-containing protein [Nanoarchaeota archaeon]
MKKKHAGGRPQKLTPLEESSLYQMYLEKKALMEIAYQYKVSQSTVIRIVNKFKEIAKWAEKE